MQAQLVQSGERVALIRRCDLGYISAISTVHLGCNLGCDLGYNLGTLFVSLMIAMHCLIARQLKHSQSSTKTVMISVPIPQLT